MNHDSDAQFLEWLADRLPAHDMQTKERLKECARRITEAASRERHSPCLAVAYAVYNGTCHYVASMEPREDGEWVRFAPETEEIKP